MRPYEVFVHSPDKPAWRPGSMCPQGDVRVYQAVELVGMNQKVVRRYLPGDDSDACAACAVAY
jgi:hypothetical protein